MKALWLDYQRPPPGWHWPGVVLLMGSVAAAAAMFFYYASLQEAIVQREEAVHRLQRRIDRAQFASAEKPGTAPGEALALKLATYSAQRWDGLLSDLDDAADETVTLLAVTPNKFAVTLEGEAKTLADAVAYAERLKEAETLKQPQLVEFGVVKGHPQKPVRFTLEAQWPGPPS